jgi:hypothetical protein
MGYETEAELRYEVGLRSRALSARRSGTSELLRINLPHTRLNREPKRMKLLDHTRPPSRDASTTRPMESTTSTGRSNWM